MGPDRTAEGEVLTAGDELVTFDVGVPNSCGAGSAGNSQEDGGAAAGCFQVGLLNCFDLRFPAASDALGQMGCHVLLYPSAWLQSTGELGHWDCLLRARALDQQLYTVGVNIAQDDAAEVVGFGHSAVYCPLGQSVGAPSLAPTAAGVVLADMSMAHLLDVRRRIPLQRCARSDDRYRQRVPATGAPVAASLP